MSIQTIYRTELSVAFIPQTENTSDELAAQDRLLEFEDDLRDHLFEFNASGGVLETSYNTGVWQVHLRLEHTSLASMESMVPVLLGVLSKYPDSSINNAQFNTPTL